MYQNTIQTNSAICLPVQTRDVEYNNFFIILSNFKDLKLPPFRLDVHIKFCIPLLGVAQREVENEGILSLCCSFQLFLQSLSAPDPVKRYSVL